MNDLITKIEQMQKEARDGMKRASGESDPYLYQYMVGKFHAFGKVAGILKKQNYTKHNALFDKCVVNCDPATMKRVSDEVDEMLEKEHKPDIFDTAAFQKGVQEGRRLEREDAL